MCLRSGRTEGGEANADGRTLEDNTAAFATKKARPKGGRPRVPDRLALTGILFVARTVTAWELLPLEL